MPPPIRLLAAAVGLLVAHAAAGQQIITQQELAQAGITRPGDLFELAFGWAVSSTDGYAWDATALGMAPGHEPEWMLFVDDHRVDLRALGRANLNMLPVPLSEVCLVEVHTQPTQIGSIIAPGGAIHARTCTPSSGVTIRGTVEVGNETGDPGPHKYLQEEDRNVDRSGPAAHGALVMGNTRRHLRLTGQIDEHHATDPLIRPRVRTLYRGEKDARIHHRAMGMQLRSSGRWGASEAWAARTHLEDLRFFQPLGLEAPVNHDLILGHLAGTFSRGTSLRLSGHRAQLSTRPNPLNMVADWDQIRLHALVQQPIRGLGTLGVRSSFLRTWGLGMEQHQLLFLHQGFLQLTAQQNPNLHATSTLEISVDDGRLGWQALGQVHYPPLSLSLVVHARSRAPAATQGYIYWSSLGYRPSGLPPTAPPQIPAATSTQSAYLSWHTGTNIQLRLTSGIRRHRSYALTQYALQYDSLTTGLSVNTSTAITFGDVAYLEGRLMSDIHERLSIGLFGGYAYPISSMHAYRAVWHTRSLLQLQIRFAPNPRLSLFGTVRYRGAANWPYYAQVATTAPERYTDVLPDDFFASLTIQKRFMGDRLRMSASLRNLANQPQRTHPGGASLRLALHVQVQLAFRAFSPAE